MSRGNVIYNEDGDLLCCLKPGRAIELTRANIDWTLDRLPIDIWEYHAATPDVCKYDTKVGEVMGRRIADDVRQFVRENPYEPPGAKPGNVQAYEAMGHDYLRDEGTDALRARAELLHARGVKLVAEMRMGDTHQPRVDPANPLVSQFLIDHPQFIIERTDRIVAVALDYKFAEVRAHRLAILREIAEEYDVDGLSLNFMRWAKYFERDWGRFYAPIMTDFIGEIRAMLDAAAKKRGTDRLLLGARVLSTEEESLGAGLDTAAWIRRGDLDYVVACEHNCSWPALNVEQFAAMAEGTNCEVYAMMGDMIGGCWHGKPDPLPRPGADAPGWTGYQRMLNRPEEARAIAANHYAWGATGIGLWNVPNNFNVHGYGKWGQDPAQRERMQSWILEAVDPRRVQTGRRTYHYLPLYKRDYHGLERNYKYLESGRSMHGAFKGPTLYFNEGKRGRRQALPFRVADGRDGEKLAGTLRFRMIHCDDGDTFDADVNGAAIDAAKLRRTVDRADAEMICTWVELDLADCSPLSGDNELGLTWTSTADHGQNVPCMEELVMTVEP